MISRGRVVVEGGALQVEAGSGEYLPCRRPQPVVDQTLAQVAPNPLANYLGLRRAESPT